MMIRPRWCGSFARYPHSLASYIPAAATLYFLSLIAYCLATVYFLFLVLNYLKFRLEGFFCVYCFREKGEYCTWLGLLDSSGNKQEDKKTEKAYSVTVLAGKRLGIELAHTRYVLLV